LNSYFESLNSYFESLNSSFESLNSYFESLNSYVEFVFPRSVQDYFLYSESGTNCNSYRLLNLKL
jgi:hypothetical protein